MFGRYESSRESSVTCKFCPSGFYSQYNASDRCYECRAGFFSAANGTVSCKFCPVGFLQENEGQDRCILPFSNSTIIKGNNNGRASQVPLAQGWFKSCEDKGTYEGEGRLCTPKPCPAGKRGTTPASERCQDCAAGKTSYKGTLDCRLCEKGKYAEFNATAKCAACKDLGGGSYSDEEGASECKTCRLGEISTGDGCQEAAADNSLPTPVNVSFQTSMENSMNLSVTVRWSCPPHDKTLRFRVKILNNPNGDDGLGTKEIFVNSRFATSATVRVDVALPVHVVHAKVQVVSVTNTLGPVGVSKDWKIKKDCASNEYLATRGLPSEWACKPCPLGGSCRGDVGAEDIVALFGWWECPSSMAKADHRKADNAPSFSECEHAQACLGASNDAWKDAYDGAMIEHNESSCALGYLEPKQANRLCTSCASGFVFVSGACIKCPAGAWSSVVPVLVVAALFICLVALVALKVRSTGSRKAPYSTMRRSLIHHIQTAMIMMSLNVDWPQPLTLFYEIVGSVVSTSEGIALVKCGNNGLSKAIRYTDPESGMSTRGVDEGMFFFILLVVYSLLPFFFLVGSYVFWSHLHRGQDCCVAACPV
jgi:hypothetical protein